MRDSAYQQRPHAAPPQTPHRYGPQVHLLACPLSLYALAQLAAPATTEPNITRLVRRLYRHLVHQMISATWPCELIDVPSRMAASHPDAAWQGMAVSAQERVVVVDIARAGTVPSQTVYEFLGETFHPEAVRQDHLLMSRVTGPDGQVTGAQLQAQKMDGGAPNATVLIPDPMGATGSTMALAADLYKNHADGAPRRVVALHLIVTPEYLQHMASLHPDVEIWALRLDRGMSSARILATLPGQDPDEERGLNERQYIIPGAGGMGELLNNTHG